MILIVLDATRPAMHKRLLEYELEGFGIRLNKKPPAIQLRKKERGGIDIIEVVKQTQMEQSTIKSILKEYRYGRYAFFILGKIFFFCVWNGDLEGIVMRLVFEGQKCFSFCFWLILL